MSGGSASRSHARGWLLDEVANAGRENLDADHVRRYDQKEDASAASEVALLQGIGLGQSSVVVDLGAGTGQFALEAAALCSKVIAVDVSPVMLRHLESKLAATTQTNVEVVQAGFLTYEHAGQRPDFVYSRYALHHLPDFWKGIAIARVRDLLRIGGVFRLWDVVYDFEPSDAEPRIEAWCASGADDIEGGWARAEFEEHVRDEHSTYTWLLEPMLERSGFVIERAEYSADGMTAAYIARAT
jgi:SAM-dependent methyltransferase